MKPTRFINSYKLFFITLVCAAVAFTSCNSSDAQAFKTQQFLGSNEVPANSSTGSGTLDGNFNTKTKVVTLNLKWSLGKTGDTSTMAHIHKGAVGVGGPVVIPIKGLPSGSTNQEFSFVSGPLTAEQEAELKAGSYYVNIHSNTYPGGELRAQLILK